ncbi:hypothetical protein AVEN_90626-1 [Araneus ventricosus]|uniref:Uncharacterized protein n=1 Tax=Araneus ventricosus TaxID=182803 RepID=A0A4Y2NU85_ARAVE|nr:hypothetical protein AVEN_90626-1 [Araneus ventricosus]
MIIQILPPDTEIVTDDEEIDDACTRNDNGHDDFDEKIQEETDGTIEILKEKDAAEYRYRGDSSTFEIPHFVAKFVAKVRGLDVTASRHPILTPVKLSSQP